MQKPSFWRTSTDRDQLSSQFFIPPLFESVQSCTDSIYSRTRREKKCMHTRNHSCTTLFFTWSTQRKLRNHTYCTCVTNWIQSSAFEIYSRTAGFFTWSTLQKLYKTVYVLTDEITPALQGFYTWSTPLKCLMQRKNVNSRSFSFYDASALSNFVSTYAEFFLDKCTRTF